jgi:hypothetical protein
MANPNRRGQSGSEISSQMQGADYTPFANTHFVLPYGLRLQQIVGQSTITNVSGNGTTVTYTVANNYSTGNRVSIYNVDPVAYNLQNVTIASASSTQFTVTNAATGTYVSGGIVQKTGTTDVTIPSGITFVYTICVGAGGGTLATISAGGAGGVAWGWTIATPSSVVGANSAGAVGGFSRYGNVIAGGGGSGATAVNGPGGAGGFSAGNTNYWGIPPGGAGTATSINGTNGSGAGGGFFGTTLSTGGNGGNGISGGGGGHASLTGSQTNTGGNGGSGLIGGGGGCAYTTTGTRTGGSGGNGINILTGQQTTGGTGTTGTSTNGAGGGGAGIAGNGSNASGTTAGNGGYGGGGAGASGQGGATTYGGAGLIYLFY